jgi:hypothetical protein
MKKIYATKQEKWKADRERNKEQRLKRKRELRNTFSGKMKDLLEKCKGRAKNKDWEFNLNLLHLINLWHNQKGLCAVSGLPMETESGIRNKIGVNPFVVSVDRINSSIGYTKTNTQLVCFAVNQMKSNFTENQFKFWIRTISKEAFNDEGTFNDYPERE